LSDEESWSTISDRPNVVLDVGSHTVRAGFASEYAPRAIFSSVVGILRGCHSIPLEGKCDVYVGDGRVGIPRVYRSNPLIDTRDVYEGSENVGIPRKYHSTPLISKRNVYVGDEAYISSKYRKMMNVKRILRNGLVADWSDFERVIHHSFYNELRIDPQEQNVIWTEPPWNTKVNQRNLAELMFEVFNVPGMYSLPTPVSCVYSTGDVSGIVLDAGFDSTHTAYVDEGCLLQKSVQRLDLGGNHLTQYLIKQQGKNMPKSREEIEAINNLKETACFCAGDDSRAKCVFGEKFDLPDGNRISLPRREHSLPELLFNPALAGNEGLGVQHLLVRSLKAVHSLLPDIKSKYLQIKVFGGSTKFKGFGNILKREFSKANGYTTANSWLSKYLQTRSIWLESSLHCSRLVAEFADWVDFEVQDNAKSKHCAFLGASILAATDGFDNLLQTREDHLESGFRSLKLRQTGISIIL